MVSFILDWLTRCSLALLMPEAARGNNRLQRNQQRLYHPTSTTF